MVMSCGFRPAVLDGLKQHVLVSLLILLAAFTDIDELIRQDVEI